MEYLVIDGYNVINAWNDVFDLSKDSLEDCRDKLFYYLSNYQGFKKINIIVVFDAYMVKGSQQKEGSYDNLSIVFTKENESADHYIERFVYEFGNVHTIRVVTSDYLEQIMIMSSGGIRVSPRELKEEMAIANGGIRENIDKINKKTNTIAANLQPEQLERLERIRRGMA